MPKYILIMDVAIKIGIDRNLFLTVSAWILIVVLVSTELLLLRVYRRLYPTVQRTTENPEVSSGIILGLLNHPLNFITKSTNAVMKLSGWSVWWKNGEDVGRKLLKMKNQNRLRAAEI